MLKEALLVELARVMFQTEAPCNKHSHLLLDTNFEFWQKIAHQARKQNILQIPSKCSIEGERKNERSKDIHNSATSQK